MLGGAGAEDVRGEKGELRLARHRGQMIDAVVELVVANGCGVVADEVHCLRHGCASPACNFE